LPETLRGNGFGVLGLVQAIGGMGSTVVAGLLWSLLSPAIAFGYVAAWTLLSVSPAIAPAGTVSLRVRNTGTLTHRVVVLPLAQGRFPDSVSVVLTARSTSPTVLTKSRELCGANDRDGIAQQRWLDHHHPARRTLRTGVQRPALSGWHAYRTRRCRPTRPAPHQPPSQPRHYRGQPSHRPACCGALANNYRQWLTAA